MRAYDDPRVVVLAHADNRGKSNARDTALRHSRAPWVIQLDSDDELAPGALSTLSHVTDRVDGDVGVVGLRWIRRHLTMRPTSPRGWAYLLLGLAGRRPMRRAMALNARMRQRPAAAR